MSNARPWIRLLLVFLSLPVAGCGESIEGPTDEDTPSVDKPILYGDGGRIYRMGPTPSEGTLLVSSGDYGAEAPQWSPKGDRIAYLGAGASWKLVARLFVASADGTGTVQLTDGSEIADGVVAFEWSPKGDMLTYWTYRHEIFVVSAAGGSPTRLVSVAEGGQRPSWSPDGNWILYDRPGLNRIRPDGSGRVQITDQAGDQNARWSPSGDLLAFECRGQDICLVRPDGTGRRFLTDRPSTGDLEPVWSPDGKWLAIKADRGRSDWDLAVIDATTGADRVVFSSEYDDIWPSWSPDGKYIVFTGRKLTSRLFLGSVGGDGSQTFLASGYHAVWHPGG